MQRRYGPTEGAGTVIIEKEAEKQINRGTLGTTVHVGIYEKGPVGVLARAATKTDFQKKAGSYINDSLAPDAAFDFHRTSRGAGDFYFLRVTDGSEVKASATIKGRRNAAIIKSVSADCGATTAFLTTADYIDMGSPQIGDRIAVYDATGGSAFAHITAIDLDTPAAGTVQLTMLGASLAAFTLLGEAKIVLFNKTINSDIMTVSANNGGRWGGKKSVIYDLAFGTGGLTATTFDTGKTMLKDFYKGATLTFAAMPGKAYEVISNTVAGILTVTTDATMSSDYASTGSSVETWKLSLLNESKEISVKITDGILEPTTEFGMVVYVDGEQVLSYENLSSDPESNRYFMNLINDDENNIYITVEDLWTGAITAPIRPANMSGQSIGLTNTVLTLEAVESEYAGTGNGYIKNFTYGGDVQEDTIEVECDDATAKTFTYTSAKLGLISSAAPGVVSAFAAPNDYLVGFTIVEGSTPFALGDKFTLHVKPMTVNSLIGGMLYPNVDTSRRTGFVIVSNTINTITVKTGSTMLTSAKIGNTFRIEAGSVLVGGYDGIANVADIDYTKNLDSSTSPINTLFGELKGLVKIAIPGVTSATVQKAGQEYSEARNYQFRVEIPANITTDEGAEQYINDTIGRNDFSVTSFPSYMYVQHPTASGLKLVSASGAIQGREALMAKNYSGYHKAAAGIDVTIPNCVKLPTGDRELDEELLNKHGIGILKFKKGNCIIWGDRTLSVDPSWKWKHQRELMSYYENDLRENFDWIIFAINDPIEQRKAHSALISYFRPEFQKRALRGDKFADAVTLKVDNEINTDVTRAQGDMFGEIALQLADTVERFIITMSKMGIFERVE